MTMADPLFLELNEVIGIHQDQIALYGGGPGIRDMGLLLSALAQPRATFGGQFLHADLPAMAAAYLFHIVQNHPFIDGNKRCGLMCAYVFLSLNGCDVGASEDALEAVLWRVAKGEMDKEQVAIFLRRHAITNRT